MKQSHGQGTESTQTAEPAPYASDGGSVVPARRRSEVRARPLDAPTITAFERRFTAAAHAKNPMREIYELRAIGRELIAHINHLEGR